METLITGPWTNLGGWGFGLSVLGAVLYLLMRGKLIPKSTHDEAMAREAQLRDYVNQTKDTALEAAQVSHEAAQQKTTALIGELLTALQEFNRRAR